MVNLEAATYERIIKTIHTIDKVCDDHEDLYSNLRYALRELANELGADTGFVYYFNAYDAPSFVAVDRHGLIQRNLEQEVVQLSARAEAADSLEPIIENELFERRYTVMPMRIGERFVGILGGTREDLLDEVELRIIAEVAMVIDSAIDHKTKEEFGKDERVLIERSIMRSTRIAPMFSSVWKPSSRRSSPRGAGHIQSGCSYFSSPTLSQIANISLTFCSRSFSRFQIYA